MSQTMIERAAARQGFVTIYVLFAMMVLLPMVGLAIDVNILYNVKAKLPDTSDAAAVGAGNTIQADTNINDPVQLAAIVDVAQRFFVANFPSNYWSSSLRLGDPPDLPVTEDASKVRSIAVSAHVSVPALFMRVAHVSSAQVGAQSTAQLRFVNMMIVVDRSGSVNNAPNNVPQTIRDVLHIYVSNGPNDTPAGQSVFQQRPRHHRPVQLWRQPPHRHGPHHEFQDQ